MNKFNENKLHILSDKEYFSHKDYKEFEKIYTRKLIREKNIDGNTPLHFLCFRGMYKSSLHNRVFNKSLNNALKKVLNLSPSTFLIKNNQGETPLHILSYNYFNKYTKDILILIIDKLKNKLNIKNNEGNTILHILCSLISLNNNTTNSILYLISKYPNIVNIKNKKGETPLHILSSRFKVKDIDNNNTPLNIEKIFKFISNNKNINILLKNNKGDSCLHTLLQNKGIINNYSYNYIKYLFMITDKIKYQKNKNGNTPLHLMVINDFYHTSINKYYNKDDYKKNLFQNNEGNTPLHLLCYIPYKEEYNKILSLLIDFKDKKNKNHQKPIQIMEQNINYESSYTFFGLS